DRVSLRRGVVPAHHGGPPGRRPERVGGVPSYRCGAELRDLRVLGEAGGLRACGPRGGPHRGGSTCSQL
ncbi:MAG: hypothetical protein AVDCRST_MAG34-1724, partial [uncultured Nocardioidaceae bacterium]